MTKMQSTQEFHENKTEKIRIQKKILSAFDSRGRPALLFCKGAFVKDFVFP